MKYKDFISEDLKHKLYTKEEMRQIKADRKNGITNNESDATLPDDNKNDSGSNTGDSNDNQTTNDASSDSVISEIKKSLTELTKTKDISTDGDVYLAKKDDKEYLGFFVYKKDLNEQDDFYVGKFIYRVPEKKFDNLLDDVKESFKTLSDAETYINSYKGQKVE